MSLYAHVLLPVAVPQLYTYAVPPALEADCQAGRRALVQFGKNKWTTAIVVRTDCEKPDFEVKEVAQIIDQRPLVTERQLSLWQWMAEYYLCTAGEVMRAALPAGLKLESETKLCAAPNYEPPGDLGDRDREVLNYVADHSGTTIADLGTALGTAPPLAAVKRLIALDALYLQEQLRDGWRPKLQPLLSLANEWRNEEALAALMTELGKRAPRQLEALVRLIQALGGMAPALEGGEVEKTLANQAAGGAASALTELVKKGYVEQRLTEVSRLAQFTTIYGPELPPCTLTPAQQVALQLTQAAWREGKPVLLHGVTGSGKTEIYIHLITDALEGGRNVLYLLPEIALTTQMTQRLARHFGSRMMVYHSKFSDGARCEVWQRLLDQPGPWLLLGVRSSLLLPLNNPGLIIVDEEHEQSYKQSDPAPRYSARDLALVLWKRANEGSEYRCDIVLGSATPSAESWRNAQTGRYALVSLPERHGQTPMPEMQVVDLAEARKRKAVHGGIFTTQLRDAVANALGRHKQVILFQNRRGFAPVIECQECAWVSKCEHCDVSLTYHKTQELLVCHYCGFTQKVGQRCPACGSAMLRPQGWGTERIEEVAQALFPEARILRMDLDSARTRTAFENLIDTFAHHNADILIGTQMLSKGLDFADVQLVGILSADSLLRMPDYRADERTFQLLTQVAGRCGRRKERGLVIIQTAQTEHPVIKSVLASDYQAHIARLLSERAAYCFPPSIRLVNILLKHRDPETVKAAARCLAADLRAFYPNSVLGPVAPFVARVANYYLQELTLKLTEAPADMKRQLCLTLDNLRAQPSFKQLIARIDVDPL